MLQRKNTSVFNLGYHLIWCPKYRRKVLVGDVEKRLKELLIEKAEAKGFSIDIMEVMPDHVHVFVKSQPRLSPQYLANQLKGYTSRMLRKEFPTLKSRLPTLWTRSYYVESVGHISEEVVRKYINDQKNK
jgi:putative transposase